MKLNSLLFIVLTMTLLLNSCGKDSGSTSSEVVVGKEEQDSLIKDMEKMFNHNEKDLTVRLEGGCVMTSTTKSVQNLKSRNNANEISLDKTIKVTNTPNCKGSSLDKTNSVSVIENSAENENQCIKSFTKTSSDTYKIISCKDETMFFNKSNKTITMDQSGEGYSVSMIMKAKNYSFNELMNDLSNIEIKFLRYNKADDSYEVYRTLNNMNAYSYLQIEL